MTGYKDSNALSAIDPTILLTAIKAGAKPRVGTHIGADHELQRSAHLQTFRLKHEEEAAQAKATEKAIDEIRGHAHSKIEAHMGEELEKRREALATAFKLKHDEAVEKAKATERAIEELRGHAHCKVEVHMNEDLEKQREELAKVHRQKHDEEAARAKATERAIDEIRGAAHCKVEAHISEDREQTREELAKSFKLKHKEEARHCKAARRRLEAIRRGAHTKVEDHMSEDKEKAAYEEQRLQAKQSQLREERRELKAHQRRLKAVTAHAGPRVSPHLSEETEHGREQWAAARAEKAKEHARQLQRSRRMLNKSLHSSGGEHAEPWKPTQEEVEFQAAVLLQAARRGSLARAIKETPSQRMRKGLDEARNNRLSRRRPAIAGDDAIMEIMTNDAIAEEAIKTASKEVASPRKEFVANEAAAMGVACLVGCA